MVTVVAHEDVAGTRRSRIHEDGRAVARTDFMRAAPGEHTRPTAFLVEEDAHRNLRVHYHDADEFQIFTAGGGTNGRHAIKPFQLHFARAYTPYGPIIASDAGCDFLTLRNRPDGGASFLPETRIKLDSVPNRKPWQVTVDVEFPEVTQGVAVKTFDAMQGDRGLAAQAIRMAPGARAAGPDASNSNGQYLVVLRGSLMYQGKEHRATTIVYLEPADGHFELHAGDEGLDAVAMNFPRHEVPAQAPRAEAGDFKVWQCVLCAFVYDEAAGMPGEGIAPGTRWQDVPQTFGCPDCSASKSDFEMIEI